jgi:enterochelin esterase-like enzyme
VLLAIHHLDDFSVIESWSGYFRPTNPAGTAVHPPHARAERPRTGSTLRARRERPTFFAFYVGAGDKRFRAENEQLDRELRAAGVPHVFRVYPGAHDQSVLAGHARAWLSLRARPPPTADPR